MAKGFVFAAAFVAVSLLGQTQPAAPKPAQTKPSAAKPVPAPPAAKMSATETALRARASEFLQYHVDGKFSKAMDLVAEDTKEAYFAGGKQKLKSYKIDSVRFNDNNSKAVVSATVTRDWNIRMQEHEVIVPMVTTWKLEKGQWFWYWDASGAWLTPMGPSKIEPPSQNPDGTIKGLPQNLGADVVAQAAQSILAQSNVDKSEVTFDTAKLGEETVVFTNGVKGVVRVGVEGVPNVPGFSAKLAKNEVSANGTVALVLSYDPPAEAATPSDFTLQVVTEPLNQGYPVRIKFRAPAPAAE